MERIVFTKDALRDVRKLKATPNLWKKAQALLSIVEENPYQNPPPYEKLCGDLQGAYSRRINRQHRLIYEVRQKEGVVVILRMWSHYE